MTKHVSAYLLPSGSSSKTSFGYAIFEQPMGLSHAFLHTSGSTQATSSEMLKNTLSHFVLYL